MAGENDGIEPDATHDDEALSWAGDEAEPLAPGWKRVGEASPVAEAAPAAGTAREAADADAPAAAPDDAAPQIGSVELVVLGILGGVYLLYLVGWLVAATGPAVELGDPVASFMYGLGRWLAVLAPATWFLVVLWFTRGRRVARLLWLVAGAILLVPIPFLIR